MADARDHWDEMLLDLHMGQLSDEQADAIRRQLDASPELAAQSRALATILGHLDADNPPEPPTDLSERVCDYIERHTAVVRFIDAQRATRSSEVVERNTVWERLWAWRDHVAAAACIALFLVFAMPGYWANRRMSARQQCLSNVRQIADGMTRYAAANNGFLPSAGYVPGGAWLPDSAGTTQPAPNSRHVFRLLKDGQIRNVRIFVCPADRFGRPMPDDANVASLQDFPSPRNNSYSLIFMNVPEGLRLEQMQQGSQRRMVLVADRNPHFPIAPPAGRRFPVPPPGNSPLHESGAGQNAIYVDGSGGWFTTPFIGVNRDDIYRIGEQDDYQGTETPRYDTDTFLPP